MNPGACKVSVVVATYNRGAGLHDHIASVLDQLFDDYEAIYVDDGSTDDTPEILRTWERDSGGRLRAMRVANGGPGPARNAGAQAARGEYLLFTDDDVLVPPDWVSGMLGIVEGSRCEAATGGFLPYAMDTPAERYLHYRMRRIFDDRPRPVPVAPMMSFLVPAALFREVGGFLPDLSEDWAFCRDFTRRGYRIYYDPSVSVVHRYQRDWAGAVRRIEAPALLGVYRRADRGEVLAPYVGYSVARFLASPVWSLWAYPLDLYGASLRMEARFCWARVRAYASTFTGRRIPTPW